MTQSRSTPALRLGTRGSALARTQAEIVIAALRARYGDLAVDPTIIRTHGDQAAGESTEDELEPLRPGEGAFVRAIEGALIQGQIDFAVHSCKDLPAADRPGLTLGAVLAREDPRDVLISREGLSLDQLPSGACVGTASPRREAIVRAVRPDVEVLAIRGNVDTRLRLLTEGRYDAVILAAAGLRRLGREGEITQSLDPDLFIPAIGQGVLAIQCRADDSRAVALLQPIDDTLVHACVRAERAVARTVAASCTTPVGAHARIEADVLHLNGFLLAAPAGLIRGRVDGAPMEAEALGQRLGALLLAGGTEAR
jgi:hydroxymethylbilane synthase